MIIYIPYELNNPEGFPVGYPKYSKQIDDKDPIPDGWIGVAEDEYKRLLEAAAAQITINAAAKDAAVRASGQDKIRAMRQLFEDCEAIDRAWDTATNAQKFELARKTYRILNRVQGSIIDLARSDE